LRRPFTTNETGRIRRACLLLTGLAVTGSRHPTPARCDTYDPSPCGTMVTTDPKTGGKLRHFFRCRRHSLPHPVHGVRTVVGSLPAHCPYGFREPHSIRRGAVPAVLHVSFRSHRMLLPHRPFAMRRLLGNDTTTFCSVMVRTMSRAPVPFVLTRSLSLSAQVRSASLPHSSRVGVCHSPLVWTSQHSDAILALLPYSLPSRLAVSFRVTAATPCFPSPLLSA